MWSFSSIIYIILSIINYWYYIVIIFIYVDNNKIYLSKKILKKLIDYIYIMYYTSIKIKVKKDLNGIKYINKGWLINMKFNKEGMQLVDIIFWDDTSFRTTFKELQNILGIKNSLRDAVKDYKPVQAK